MMERISISGSATTVTVSSGSATPLTSLTGVSTVPIGMLHQQLLVQSGAGGVRQLLFPLNFSSSRGGTSTPRYIQVRQVTMSGQSGVLSFPARFGTPITMRAVAHTAVNVQTQPGQQQIQQTQEPTVTTVKPALTGDTHVILSSEIPVATQPVPKSSTGITGPQKTTSFGAELESPSTCSALMVTPKSEPITIAAVPVAVSTTTSVLRLVPQSCVPTVNRVSLPVPAGIDTNALLTSTVTVNRTIVTSTPTPPLTLAPIPVEPPVVATAVVEEPDHSKWNEQGTPSGSRNSVDDSVTPAADEKLLNDAETGVSEFLPCADFMGPGVSPSPCFSLSDSPLGSQNSSPATSPATFQASSTEEDSNGLVTPGDGDLPPPGGNSRKLSKSKILKRNVKPRMVMVRKDHGGMEYRRMSDGEGGPAVIRNDRRVLGKRLASKQVAVATTTVAATTISSSSSPAQPESRTSSPCAQSPVSLQPHFDDSESTRTVVQAVRLVIKKEGDISVVKSKSMSTTPNKPTELVAELAETGKQNQNDASSTSADRTGNDVSLKEEPPNEEDTNINAVSTESSMEMEEYIVRPRRCGRLQKEEVLNQHDPDVCPLSERGTTKRRSSVRTNVKKNCPCCVTVSEGRKRTKSEPPCMDNASPEHTSPAKKALINTATSCAALAGVVSTAASTTTVSTSTPTLAVNRPKTTKKYAQRKR